MMQPVMMAPVVVVAPGPVAADTTRTKIGHYDTAARGHVISWVIVVRVIVIVRIIVEDAADEDAPEVVPVGEPMAAMAKAAITKAASTDRWAGAQGAAVNGSGAAEAPATNEPTTMSAMPTMPAADFNHQAVGNDFVRGSGTRIDQRQRFGALAGGG